KPLWISSGILGGWLLLSVVVMIASALPDVGTGGNIVNYGSSAEVIVEEHMTVDEVSSDPNDEHVRPEKVDPQQEIQETPSQQVTEQSVATQDMEDAPAVVANKAKKANAEEATAEKEESKPAINPNALYTGKRNNSTGRGDGTGTEGGNQGSNQGDPLASHYGEGGSCDGDVGLSIPNRGCAV